MKMKDKRKREREDRIVLAGRLHMERAREERRQVGRDPGER